MTPSIDTLFKVLRAMMLSFVILSVAIFCRHAECRYAECRYAECRNLDKNVDTVWTKMY